MKKSMYPSQWRWSAGNTALKTTPLARICVGNAYRNLFNARYNFTSQSRLSLALRPVTTSALKSLCWSCLCVKKSMCPSQWRWSARKKHLNPRPLARICVGNAYRNLFNARYNFTSQSRLSLALRPVTMSALMSLCWSCLYVKKSMFPSRWRWSAGNKALKTTAACSDLQWQCIQKLVHCTLQLY